MYEYTCSCAVDDGGRGGQPLRVHAAAERAGERDAALAHRVARDRGPRAVAVELGRGARGAHRGAHHHGQPAGAAARAVRRRRARRALAQLPPHPARQRAATRRTGEHLGLRGRRRLQQRAPRAPAAATAAAATSASARRQPRAHYERQLARLPTRTDRIHGRSATAYATMLYTSIYMYMYIIFNTLLTAPILISFEAY